MRNFNPGLLKLYALMLIFLISQALLLNHVSFFINYFQPLFLLFVAFVAFKFNFGIKDRKKYKRQLNETIVIIMLMYFIIYCVSGLFFGFVRSPFNHSIPGIIRNIYYFTFATVLLEYIRFVLVKFSGNKKRYFFLIVLMFVVTELNFRSFSQNFASGETAFIFLSNTIVPAFCQSFLATYLAKVVGLKGVLLFRLPLSLMVILLPLYPDLNWFLASLYQVILVLLIYIFTTSFVEKKIIRLKQKRIKKSLLKTITGVTLITLFALFMTGFFRYRPIAVMSNSMLYTFGRGDLVISKRNLDIEEIQLYGIIVYVVDRTTVIHRVVEIDIDEDKKIFFVTKGDNNNAVDDYLVREEQIVGIVNSRIPLVGFPTVWINEILGGK